MGILLIVIGLFSISFVCALVDDALFGAARKEKHRKNVEEWILGLRSKYPTL